MGNARERPFTRANARERPVAYIPRARDVRRASFLRCVLASRYGVVIFVGHPFAQRFLLAAAFIRSKIAAHPSHILAPKAGPFADTWIRVAPSFPLRGAEGATREILKLAVVFPVRLRPLTIFLLSTCCLIRRNITVWKRVNAHLDGPITQIVIL